MPKGRATQAQDLAVCYQLVFGPDISTSRPLNHIDPTIPTSKHLLPVVYWEFLSLPLVLLVSRSLGGIDCKLFRKLFFGYNWLCHYVLSQQEDSHQIATLTLDPEELRLSVQKSFELDWNPNALGAEFARQIVFVGIYDGHGGQAVSLYLHQNLHGIFESVDKSQIPDVYAWTKEIGGYFKRFRGGVLQPWLARPPSTESLDLGTRATLAFLEASTALIWLFLSLSYELTSWIGRQGYAWGKNMRCYSICRTNAFSRCPC